MAQFAFADQEWRRGQIGTPAYVAGRTFWSSL